MTNIDELRKKFEGVIITEGKPLPHVVEFEEWDKALLKDVYEVFLKHGLKGKIERIEFEITPEDDERKPGCYRVCHKFPDGRIVCHWICPYF